jgi:two-component system sensor histidine kinase KdpD
VRLLHGIVPYGGAGVVYVPAVIAVASLFDLAAGLVTSVLAMLAYNILFLPPRFTVTLDDAHNWVLLAVLVISTGVVAELSTRERRRAEEAREREREAALLAGLASALVGGASLDRELADAARVAAAASGARSGSIVLGRGPLPGQEQVLALEVEGRTLGRLELRGAAPDVEHDPQALRVASSLAGLLALAQEHEELASAQVEAEALRRSDSLKTALLRAVSHELRSPLTAIKTTVSALLGVEVALDPATTRALLEDVDAETDRLEHLVGDLLDLSRLQAGGMVTSKDWCDVADIVRGAVAAARGRIGDQPVEVALPDSLPLVHVDPAQIERVLVNLLENAARYSPAGRPVELAADAADDGVEVFVTDHGTGIPTEDHERVFEPFYRAGPRRPQGGTGLGLAIARGFVEASGGSLTIAASPQRGTRMRVWLPGEPQPGGTLEQEA